MLSGEQKCPFGVQGAPLVTLWPFPSQVHRTVSPTEMLTVLGSNVKVPPGATVTSTVVLVADGTPRTAGRPFWSTIRSGGVLLALGILAGFSPDSARPKNPVVTMTATQNVNLAAFDIFMLLVLFCAPGFPDFAIQN